MYTKKTKIKKASKRVPEFHYFDDESKFTQLSKDTAKEAFSGSNLGGSLSSVLGGVTNVVKAGMDNAKIADTSEQHAEREDRMSEQSNATDNSSLLSEMADDVAIGSTSWRSIRGSTPGQQIGNTFKGMASGAAAGAKVGGPWGAVAGAAAGLVSGVAGIFTGNAKARREARILNQEAQKANLAKASTFANKAGGLDAASDARAAAVFAAEGGKINLPKFPYFDDGITEFNTGGTHEENPYSGIPQGIAADGYPNLVEEGEVKFKDYIFSDRTKPKLDEIMPIYKKAKKKDSFADLAKKISKEAEERPNDIISKTTRDYQLGKLAELQEIGRQRRGLKGTQRLLSKGGHLYNNTTSNYYEATDTDGNPIILEDPDKDFEVTPDPFVVSPDLNALYNVVKPKKGKTQSNSGSPWHASLLEASPAITAGVGALTTLFDSHDPSKNIRRFNTQPKYLTYQDVGEKQVYKPIDQQYIYNQASAQGRAATRGIQQSLANPYAAQSYLLTENKNQRNNLGDLGVKIDMANTERRNAVTAFNNQLDLANATNRMKVDSVNAELKAQKDKMDFQKAYYIDALENQDQAGKDKALSASLSDLGTNLGKIGTQKKSKAFIEKYAKENPEALRYILEFLNA